MMLGQVDVAKLSPELFRDLRDFIYKNSGIFFPENKLYLLENRLSTRMKELGMPTFKDYFRYLLRHAEQSEELIKIYSLITINETYFYRHPAQLDIFHKVLLPTLVEEKTKAGNNEIKVWSAASSSGEELITIAMIMHEYFGSSMPRWNLDLKGTDISERTIQAAQTGSYGKNSFRGRLAPRYLSKYFSSSGDRSIVNQDILKMVHYEFLNLNDVGAIRKNRGLDFIFCRNVLIYFDKAMKQKVLRAFYDVLNPGGYLLLGETESLHGINSLYKVEHFPGAFVYQKAQ